MFCKNLRTSKPPTVAQVSTICIMGLILHPQHDGIGDCGPCGFEVSGCSNVSIPPNANLESHK